MSPSIKRVDALDHLRGFLILCVVAGHLLEVFLFRFSYELYITIYSFHMPAFAFLSGMCCNSFKVSHLAKAYIYPYVIFQTLYLLFEKYILQTANQWQYTTPYWLLWYLLALLLWHILLKMFLICPKKWIAIVVSLVLALLAGYVDSIGYYGSLSRSLVMFPFFLGGYCAKSYLPRYIRFFTKPSKALWGIRCAAVCVAAGIIVFFFQSASKIPANWMYHALSYNKQGSTIFHRAVILGIAWLWIMILYIWVPQKRITLLAYCGRNTMPIFLFHGFIIKLLRIHLPRLEMHHSRMLFLLLSIFIPLILCSKPFVYLTKFLWSFPQKKKIQ